MSSRSTQTSLTPVRAASPDSGVNLQPSPWLSSCMDLGMKKTMPLSWEAALEAVPAALKTEGFGVLTRIDVQATLKEKLGVDFRRYTILGACNPTFAHRALTQRLDVGLLLPCNVVLHESDDQKSVELLVIDPMQTMASVLGEAFNALAGEVRAKLARVVAHLPGK